MREKVAAVLGEVPGQGIVYRQGGVGQLRAGHPEPRQAGRPLPHHAGHHPGQRRLPGRLPGGGERRQDAGVGAGQGSGERGRHSVAARPPLLRPRHRGQGAHARLLHDGAESPRRENPTSPHASAQAASAYTVPAPQIAYGDAEGDLKGGGVPQGRPKTRKATVNSSRSRKRSRSAGGGGAGGGRLPTPAKRRRCGNEARRMRGRPAPRAVADALPRPAGDGRRLRLVQGRGLRGRRKAGVRGVLRLRAPRHGAASLLPEVPPDRHRGCADSRARRAWLSTSWCAPVPSPPSGGAA